MFLAKMNYVVGVTHLTDSWKNFNDQRKKEELLIEDSNHNFKMLKDFSLVSVYFVT